MDQFGAEASAVLYTQTGCSDSARVRASFRMSGVPFVERNVTGDDEAAAALLATGMFATPVVVANRWPLIGRDLSALAEALGFVCRCADGGRG